LSTRRYGGLSHQIELFSTQTFSKSDFELVVIDGFYWLREQEIKDIASKHGLKLVYEKPRKLKRKVSIDHPSMRNDSLVYANGELILFFDDYQIPTDTLLEEHWKVYQMGYCCQGKQYFFDKTDFDKLTKIESFYASNVDLGTSSRIVPSSVFYTHNSSAPLRELIKINGFDERFNSGTGGEDYDCGMRLGLVGNKMVYNPNAVCYHMKHEGIQIYPATPDICGNIYRAKTKEMFLETYPTAKEDDISWVDWSDISIFASNDRKSDGPKYGNHDRSPLYRHPKFTGETSTASLDTWNDQGLMFCKCKICGWEGVVDSIPLYQWNVAHRNAIAPKEYFDLQHARDQIGGRP